MSDCSNGLNFIVENWNKNRALSWKCSIPLSLTPLIIKFGWGRGKGQIKTKNIGYIILTCLCFLISENSFCWLLLIPSLQKEQSNNAILTFESKDNSLNCHHLYDCGSACYYVLGGSLEWCQIWPEDSFTSLLKPLQCYVSSPFTTDAVCSLCYLNGLF